MRGHKHIVRSAAALAAAAVLAPAASAQVFVTDNSALTRSSAASRYSAQALKALGERSQAQADAYVASHSQQKYTSIPGVADSPQPVAAEVSSGAAGPAPISENSSVFGEVSRAQEAAYAAKQYALVSGIPTSAEPAAGAAAAPASSGDGFAWADAAVGAGIGAALAVLALLGAISIRARRPLASA